jgi:hypothetical protein
MHEVFKSVRKGSEVVIETAYEVLEIDQHRGTLTLRNKRNGEVTKHTDWWFTNIQQNGFTIHIV